MLTLTDTATTVVKTIVASTPDVQEGGLRIAPGAGEDRDLAVSVVPAAQPGDQTVERDGATVFLESGTSELLDDKTLDAQVGENGSVTFALVPQV